MESAIRLCFPSSTCIFLAAGLVVSPLAESAGGAQPSEVVIIAEEYAFEAPDRIAAGWRTIRLKNRGRDVHHVQFLKLPASKTAADFHNALKIDSTRLPSWVVRHGGVNSVMPDDEAVVVIELDPGDYVLICGIPDERGRPHVVHGMTKSLLVAEPAASSNGAPTPDVTISMKEFSYAFDRPLTEGDRMVLVRNDGRQAHEVLLLALAPGASVLDFLEFYKPGTPRNPAGRTIGGMTGLEPGRQGFFSLHVKAERYGILCFLADPYRRRPHFMDGMWMDIDVPPLAPPAGR